MEESTKIKPMFVWSQDDALLSALYSVSRLFFFSHQTAALETPPRAEPDDQEKVISELKNISVEKVIIQTESFIAELENKSVQKKT